MDSGFREFRQTPRGKGFILLGFYTLFKCFVMFRLVQGLERPLISSRTWNRNEKKIMEPNGMAVTVCVLCGLFRGVNCINCATNCIVICIGPEMAVKFGFTK